MFDLLFGGGLAKFDVLVVLFELLGPSRHKLGTVHKSTVVDADVAAVERAVSFSLHAFFNVTEPTLGVKVKSLSAGYLPILNFVYSLINLIELAELLLLLFVAR